MGHSRGWSTGTLRGKSQPIPPPTNRDEFPSHGFIKPVPALLGYEQRCQARILYCHLACSANSRQDQVPGECWDWLSMGDGHGAP